MNGRLHVSGNWSLKLQVEVFQASSNVPFRNRPELTKQIRVIEHEHERHFFGSGGVVGVGVGGVGVGVVGVGCWGWGRGGW